MYIPRSVTAVLEERLLFNFRVDSQWLAGQMPVPWLEPLVVGQSSVLSFCILHLKDVTIAPLPGSVIGYKTISCAYRCGVRDTSNGTATPAVWIVDRLTDLPLIAKLSPWLLADTLPTIRPRITHADEQISVEIDFPDCERLFKAEMRKSTNGFKSQIFGSMEEFGAFIHNGVTSYAASIYGDQLTKIDLIKEDPVYTPMDAEIDFSWLGGVWKDAGLQFDSAVRAHGGKYRWNYRGLVATAPHAALAREMRIPEGVA